MKILRLAVLILLCTPAALAETARNDDSCDVATLPAATLLLPYFEVDTQAPVESARTTLFTLVNTTRTPQIANVTIWTSWAYPVLTFDVFLTGYDVQSINMRDVVMRGVLADATSRRTPGPRSAPNFGNPNFLGGANESCADLPPDIPPNLLIDLERALRFGDTSECGPQRVGGGHDRFAIGYATIDVVAICAGERPGSTEYFSRLLYDNVLTGDWQIIQPDHVRGNFAAGAPLVHLRAIPEGGPSGTTAETNLPYTFYERLLPLASKRSDRRQPLPSTFVARWINGGSGVFRTSYLVWREVPLPGPEQAACTDYEIAQNSGMGFADAVTFDERENASALAQNGPLSSRPRMPATGRVDTNTAPTSGDVGGWTYINLNNGGSNHYTSAVDHRGAAGPANTSVTLGPRTSQNWVVPVMSAEGRYSVAIEATAMANGCSLSLPVTNQNNPIRPGANVTP